MARIALLRGVLAGACLLAIGSCGRDMPSSSSGVTRATINFALQFQTQTSTSPTDVTSITVNVYKLDPAAPGGRTKIAGKLFDVSNAAGNNDNSDHITLTIDFPLQGERTTYEVDGTASNSSGVVLYGVGPLTFPASALNTTGGATVTGTAVFIGPGSEAASVVASQHTATMQPGTQLQLAAQALTSTGAAIGGALFRWIALDPQIVQVDDRSGLVIAQNQPGIGRIVVEILDTPTKADTVRVTVVFTPVSIQIVSGSGQSARVSTQLPTLIGVRVFGQNNTPLPGVTVQFAPNGSGAVASPSSAVTDGTGLAQTRWTLGSVVGAQTMQVSVAGLTPVQVSANATALPAVATKLTITSVLPTAITTAGTATITVSATDASNVGVSGVQVTFSASGSGNNFNQVSSVTGGNGLVTTVFSSTVVGTKTITATAGALTDQTTVPVTTVTNAATQLIKVSGDGQTVHYGTLFSQSLVVKAADALGNPVAGALIDWGSGNGDIRKVTDANGLSSNQYQLPNDPASYPPGSNAITLRLVGTNVIVTFTYIAAP